MAVLLGCTPGEFEEEPGLVENQFTLDTDNGLSLNGLTDNGLSLNGLTDTDMADNGLAFKDWFNNQQSPDGNATEGQCTDRDEHSTIMSYVVKCACASGTTRQFTESSGPNCSRTKTHTWNGLMGLSTSWCDGSALDTAGKEFMTACLAAHINSGQNHVRISLRGNAATLNTVDTLENEYWWTNTAGVANTEGAFYGNLWNVYTESPNKMKIFACDHNEWTLARLKQLGRGCSRSGVCPSMTYAGDVCDAWDGGFVARKCTSLYWSGAGANGPGATAAYWYGNCKDPNGSAYNYNKAITVQVPRFSRSDQAYGPAGNVGNDVSYCASKSVGVLVDTALNVANGYRDGCYKDGTGAVVNSGAWDGHRYTLPNTTMDYIVYPQELRSTGARILLINYTASVDTYLKVSINDGSTWLNSGNPYLLPATGSNTGELNGKSSWKLFKITGINFTSLTPTIKLMKKTSTQAAPSLGGVGIIP